MKVYLWGIGKGCRKVLANYKSSEEIEGFIDNNPEYAGKYFESKRIVMFKDVKDDFDYIIVTVMKYEAIKYQIAHSAVDMNKVIFYFDGSQDEEKLSAFFDRKDWRIDLLEKRVEELEWLVNIRFSNVGYEIADKIQKNKYQFPVLHSDEEAVNRIVNDKCSMIRFGDADIEIMAGKSGINYQQLDEELATRLKEVIQSDQENILIGIADNYGDLGIYTDEIADGIREYMTDEVREYHLSVLNLNKVYYNAYMFKCYYPYKDRTKTRERVNLVKRIWDGRDVVLIEGMETRTGQGNDLLDNANSVQRILCPTKNAFSHYAEIAAAAKKVPRESLILCVLGPAGKVLAYELISCGYQVVDIGQIDMDYEWYRVNAEVKVPNPTKYVSQLPPAEIEDVDDEEYAAQIIARITD